MVLKLSKMQNFFAFFADVSNKSKAVIAVYVYASEGFRFTLLENGIGYVLWHIVPKILAFEDGEFR